MVKKKDGSIQMCVDFRRLNSVTPVDAYPMPRADELIDELVELSTSLHWTCQKGIGKFR